MSQDEDLPADAQAGGLQHQLHGFRDGHEVALHLRVGDRHRPAGGDLALEVSTTLPRQPSTLPKRTDT